MESKYLPPPEYMILSVRSSRKSLPSSTIDTAASATHAVPPPLLLTAHQPSIWSAPRTDGIRSLVKYRRGGIYMRQFRRDKFGRGFFCYKSFEMEFFGTFPPPRGSSLLTGKKLLADAPIPPVGPKFPHNFPMGTTQTSSKKTGACGINNPCFLHHFTFASIFV